METSIHNLDMRRGWKIALRVLLILFLVLTGGILRLYHSSPVYASGVSPKALTVYGQSSFTTTTTNTVKVTGLNHPTFVALDSSSNLYVADFSNNRVLYYPAGSTAATRVYGQGGSFTTSTANSGGISANSLSGPQGLTLDSSGNLYVADASNNRVLYYAAGSTTATRVYGQSSFTTNTANNGGISTNSLSAPQGLALDSSGNLYVADTNNNRVLYYAAGSTTATQVYGQGGIFTTSTANNGGISANSLSLPYGVVLDSSGNLYVADFSNNRMLYYPAGSTTATRVYGQASSFATNTANNGGVNANSLSGPQGLALDSSGNLYVANASTNRVLYYVAGSTTATRVYGQAGSFTTSTANNGGTSASSLSLPYGVVLDSSSNLYIVDANNNRVLYYAAGSTMATRVYGQGDNFSAGQVNSSGVSASNLDQPYGIALDSSGNLYVADTVNSRVLYYPAGSTTATRVYGQGGSFTSGTANNGGLNANSLSRPVGLVLDNTGNLYVADGSNNRVLYYVAASTTATRVYGQAGSFTSNTSNNGGLSANSLSLPYGVALDSNGYLYVADFNNNRVLYYVAASTTATRVYGQAGSFTTNTANNGGIISSSLYNPGAIVLDSTDNLYICDQRNNRVLYFIAGSITATRVYGQLGLFTTSTSNNGGINASAISTPLGIGVDSNGNIYVSDKNNRVLKFQTSLSISTQPPANIAPNTSFTIASQTIDVGSASVFSDFTGTVTAAIKAGTGTGGATLGGTTSVSTVGGVATFHNLSIDTNGIGYILIVSSLGVGSATTNAITIGLAASPVAVVAYGQGGSLTTVTANNGGISAISLQGPRYVTLDNSGNLYVADTGNNRVLFYAAGSTTATRVYGQAGSFTTVTANNGGISANSLSQPMGLNLDSSGNLYVADTGNNRVLYYAAGSTTATRVYGQAGSFTIATANTGGISANTLSQPMSLDLDSSNNLYVADTGNNRVLFYAAGCTTATRVYGQAGSFSSNTANNGGISADSLNVPGNLALDSINNLYIVDTNNNRMLYYSGSSTTATRIYGQAGSFVTNAINNGGVSASSLNTPGSAAIGSTGIIYVADTNNNRTLEFQTSLSITVQPPTSMTVGPPFSLVSSLIDVGSGSVFSDFTGTVSVAIKAGTGTAGAVLGGTTALSAASGVATFNNLSLNMAGSGYILTISSPGVGSANTNTIAVNTGVSPVALTVYGQGGSFTANITNNGGISAIGFQSPKQTVLDSSGDLYVIDTGNNRVLFFPSGSMTATRVYGQGGSFSSNTSNNGGVSANSLNSPVSLALDNNGNLYVADTSNNRVLYYPAGSTTATRVYGQAASFISTASNNGGISANSLSSPGGINLDTSGNLYVADTGNNRLLYYPAGSTTATRVYGQAASFISNTSNNGGISANSLKAPRGVTLDNNGNLYVADTSNNRVLYYSAGSTTATLVYGQRGSFTSASTGVTTTNLNSPYTASIDSNGDLYISDLNNNRVLFFLPGSTTATRVYGQGGSFTSSVVNNGGVRATSLYHPISVALDTNGNIYITEDGNNRILKFQTSLNLVTQPPAGIGINAPFTMAVNQIDVGSGSAFSDFTGPISIGIKAGSGTSGAVLSGTTSPSASGGIVTFSNLSINMIGNSYILTATSPGVISLDTNLFNVGPALLFTPLTIPVFTVTLTGSATPVTFQHTFTVTDNSSSGIGWHLTLTSTQFITEDGTTTLPTTVTTITGVTTACVSGQTCTVPVNGISGYPLTIPADTTAPLALNYFSANGGTGTGDVALTTTFALSVPPGTVSGTYTSTFTETLVKGQ